MMVHSLPSASNAAVIASAGEPSYLCHSLRPSELVLTNCIFELLFNNYILVERVRVGIRSIGIDYRLASKILSNSPNFPLAGHVLHFLLVLLLFLSSVIISHLPVSFPFLILFTFPRCFNCKTSISF